METRLLQSVLEEFLGRNRGPGYRLEVTHVAADGLRIDVAVTFVTGRTYCCGEPFCHVPYNPSTLVQFAAERGVVLPADAEVHWSFVVEEGALLACNKAFGAPLAAKRQEYTAVSTSAGRITTRCSGPAPASGSPGPCGQSCLPAGPGH